MRAQEWAWALMHELANSTCICYRQDAAHPHEHEVWCAYRKTIEEICTRMGSTVRDVLGMIRG